MKKCLILLAHPHLKDASLANAIVIKEVEALESVEVRDLYTLYPDFNIDVESEQQALLDAECVVFQFPFYWYSVPGILKEWQDLVLTYGFAYGSTGNKLEGKEFVISTTIGGPEEAYKRDGYNHFEINTLLTPLEQTSNLTKMVYNPPIISHGMVYIEGVYNKKDEVEARARNHARRLCEWIRLKQAG